MAPGLLQLQALVLLICGCAALVLFGERLQTGEAAEPPSAAAGLPPQKQQQQQQQQQQAAAGLLLASGSSSIGRGGNNATAILSRVASLPASPTTHRHGGGRGKSEGSKAPGLAAAPAAAAVAAAPRRPPIVALDFQLPARGLYPARHPYWVAAYTLGVGLEARNWTSVLNPSTQQPQQPERPVHLVVRLPAADRAADLRPFTRLLVVLSLLLAAEEAGVPASRFEQVHFVAPVAPPTLMRGPAGDSGGADRTATTTTASVAAMSSSVMEEEEAGGATPAVVSSPPLPTAVDADGVKHWRWSVHLGGKQSPAELFTRPWMGPSEEEATVAAATAPAAAAASGSGGDVLERSLKKRPGSGVGLGGGPLLGGQAAALVTTKVTDHDVHELGGFGRYPSSWVEAFGLREGKRAERLRALAWGLCNVTAPTAATATDEAAKASGGGGPLRVVVYNRDATRRLRHAHNVTAALKARLPEGSEVTLVVHREDRPICDTMRLLAGADALVTPHGFSAMFALFMPPGSLLVEINPYRFGGFEPYARVASAFGVEHVGVASEPVRKLQPALLDLIAPLFLPGHDPRRCKESSVCRFLARQFPVRLDEETQLDDLAQRIKDGGARRRWRMQQQHQQQQKQQEDGR